MKRFTKTILLTLVATMMLATGCTSTSTDADTSEETTVAGDSEETTVADDSGEASDSGEEETEASE